MQLQIKTGEKSFIVTVPDQFSDGQPFNVSVGAKALSMRWHRLLETFYIIDSNGLEQPIRLRNFHIESFADEPETMIHEEFGVAGAMHLHCAETVVQRYSPAQEARAQSTEKKVQTLRSQITGKVLKILVNEGQVVTATEPLLIIEAMKMENRIFARSGGKVSGIKVKEGALVSTGDELMRIG